MGSFRGRWKGRRREEDEGFWPASTSSQEPELHSRRPLHSLLGFRRAARSFPEKEILWTRGERFRGRGQKPSPGAHEMLRSPARGPQSACHGAAGRTWRCPRLPPLLRPRSRPSSLDSGRTSSEGQERDGMVRREAPNSPQGRKKQSSICHWKGSVSRPIVSILSSWVGGLQLITASMIIYARDKDSGPLTSCKKVSTMHLGSRRSLSPLLQFFSSFSSATWSSSQGLNWRQGHNGFPDTE